MSCPRFKILGVEIYDFVVFIVNFPAVNVNQNTFRRRGFGIITRVKARRKKKPDERPVFDSIRKPTAPATQKFGGSRPEDKLRPSQRKVKHKKDPTADA
jgi:hypothetical protein